MAYTAIDDPSAYFKVQLYTGTGSSNAITFDDTDTDMQPDLVWGKQRNGTNQHHLHDAVRGVTKRIRADSDDAEDTQAEGLKSFDSDGFTMGTASFVNASDDTYVAWCWKAGTSFSNDASATSVGSIDSTGSISTDNGFGIISWTGTGVDATIAHGLGVAPKIVFVKNRSATNNWRSSFTIADGSYDYMHINASDGKSDEPVAAPTSAVFSVYSHAQANGDGNDMIAYVFAEKQGFSKFGSFVGNGNADGPFVYTGFRPAFIMYKNTARSISWLIHDNKRLGYNPDNDEQHPDTTAADGTDDRNDILSNGFKVKEDSALMNTDGETVIYAAFAESPFVNSNGVPTNAR